MKNKVVMKSFKIKSVELFVKALQARFQVFGLKILPNLYVVIIYHRKLEKAHVIAGVYCSAGS